MAIHLQLPPLYPKQAEIAACTARFQVAGTGRQVGKSLFDSEVLIHRGGTLHQACWLIAPDYRRTGYVLKYLLQFLKPVIGRGVKYRQKDYRFEFDAGGYIQLVSADDPFALQGDTLDFALFDEAAYIKPEAWFTSVLPMLSVRHGSALFTSTFFGRNWFYELFTYARDSGDPEWKAFSWTSYDSPYQRKTDLDAIRRITPPSVFAQQYLAEPMEDNALVFQNIRHAAVLSPEEKPQLGHTYVAGLDWGNNQDYSVLIIVDASVSPMRQVHKYRFNQVGWEVQWGWLSKILPFWNPSMVIVEKNAAGDANITALQQQGVKNLVRFDTNWVSKRLLIEGWRLGIEQDNCLLLKDDDIIQEHMAFEAVMTQDGNIKYRAPRGMHDDTVIASALAWHGASGQASAGKILKKKVGGLWDHQIQRSYPLWGGQRTPASPR